MWVESVRKFRVVVVLLSVFLVGCSNIGLGYRFAPDYLSWQANKYFDLSSRQEDLLEDELDKLQKWHKKEELPKYVASLKELRTKVRNNDLVEVYPWFNGELEGIQGRFYQQNLATMTELLLSLSDKQLDHYQEKTKEQARERYQDYDRRDTQERWEDSLDDWLGDVSREQERYIQDWMTMLPNNYAKLRYDYNQALNSAFVAAVKSKDVPFIQQWLQGKAAIDAPEYLALREQMDAKNAEMTAKIVASLSAKQRKHLIGKLDDLIEDLEDIYQ